MRAKPIKCKKCGSTKVQLRLLAGPTTTVYKKESLWKYLLGFHLFRRKEKYRRKVYQKIAFCKECGYSWNLRVKHGRW